MVTVRGGRGLEHALDRIGKGLGESEKVLRVGFLEDATYPDGTPVATVAAANEFGTSTIPPRPFFRNMIAAKKAGWGPASAKLLKANDYDVDHTLNQVGMGIQGQLQQSILDTNAPPLAEATVKAKGFDKPLIDTGQMIRSVDYEVADKA